MPIYEFKCERCGAVFERLFRNAGEPQAEADCPECGTPEGRRLISGVSGPAPKTGAACSINSG